MPRQLSQTDPDGHTTTWTYDPAGRESSTSFDGKLVAGVDRDLIRRRMTVTDHTGPDGLAVEHELTYNRRGQLTSRTRGGEGLSWDYDADGNRTRFTDARGTTTTYVRNAAGQVTAVRNPRLGEAVFTYDAAGRITSATAGDLLQEWTYRHGQLSEHTRMDGADPGTADVTMIGRDGDGRITALTRSGAVTRYAYDGAGQLTAATTIRNGSPGTSGPASVSEWIYDAGGRLTREVTPAGTRDHKYDAAGQLLAVTDTDGTRTEYVHDGLGRRTRLIRPDGSWTEYAWGQTGHLKSVAERTPDGTATSRHELWVDALGELAIANGSELWWDTGTPIPTLVGVGAEQILTLPGGVTGIGDAWLAPGWRPARPTAQADPWAVIGAAVAAPPEPGNTSAGAAGMDPLSGLAGVLPAGITLTGNGGLDVAGLEWLGARAYDPATRGFLSTDPLAPILGAGWDGNPYAYAGNNPLNTTDPTGLRPLTDAELKAYDGSNRGAFATAGNWVKDNWEYLAGGAMVIAGGALLATGIGGPVGMMLIGAGADMIIQKATTGEVNVGEVLLSGALGGFGGAGIAARAGLTGMKASLVAGASSGGISGGIQGTYGYYSGAGPHTVEGALGATAQGTVFGAATGGAGGAVGQKISKKVMAAVTVRPGAGTMAMGRSMSQRVQPYADAHGMGYYTALPNKFYDFTEDHFPNSYESIHLWANKKWINYQKMQGKFLVDIGAPDEALRPDGVPALSPSPYYDMELDQVSGYPRYSQDPQPSWNLGDSHGISGEVLQGS